MGDAINLSAQLLQSPLENLTSDQLEQIINCPGALSLRLHRFKRAMSLRRVQRVLGVLYSLSPENILDIGSGRGAFLWPLLDEFPLLPITTCDILPHRLHDLAAVRAGGITRLTVIGASATAMPFASQAFDVITFLEILEHIPDAQRALSEAARVARRAIVLSVPSKPDDNPEHIHLFNEATLRQMFTAAGVTRVNFQYVLNHLIAVATLA